MAFWKKERDEVAKEQIKERAERIYNADWMDHLIQENSSKEEISHLLGKPINLNEPLDFDYQLNKTLKNANFLPPWIELQHEIRDQIGQLLSGMDQMVDAQIDEEIKEINTKIRNYNQTCPVANLQKSPIYKDSITIQYNKWV